MDNDTRAALELSIEHWQANIDVENPFDASTKASDCALCEKFCSKEAVENDSGCEGCPVAETTGRLQCRDTPYYEAAMLLGAWKSDPYSIAKTVAFKRSAKKELDFLKSLRPEIPKGTDDDT